MTDREIVKRVRTAYALSETAKGKRFVREHEKRSMQILDIIKLEFKYMGLQSLVAGIILCISFLIVAKTWDFDSVWTVSSLIPICAVIPVFFLSKSERCGMVELEASSRFSLRFVRLVRMFIIGLFTMGLFLAIGIILKSVSMVTEIEYVIFVIIPYLVSVFGAMLVARKWHGRENIFGLFGTCVFGSVLPFLIKEIRSAGVFPDLFLGVAAVILFVAVIREGYFYIKESENVSWNWC